MNAAPLKLVFAGTPEFAATQLSALLASPHSVMAVYTQPDRPAGRGRALEESAVKKLALQARIPVFQPTTLKDPLEAQKLKDLGADLMVVAAYGLILPIAILEAPRLGYCLNVHASLLPRWRGASPIQQAILAGDERSGITIMKMDQGLDTGPSLLKAECPIHPDDTSEKLHDRLAELGTTTLLSALDLITEGRASFEVQDSDPQRIKLAPKIQKEQGLLNWTEPALALDRKIRAFYPWPIAFTLFQGEVLRIHAAKVLPGTTKDAPGTITAVSKEGLEIATGEGSLRLLRIQAPGGRVLAITDFLNARKTALVVGKKFE